MLQDGYAPLSTVLGLREFSRFKHTAEEVQELVERDQKRRFELTTRAGEMWIRATQGHTMRSVKDDALLQPMGLEEAQEVESCVHGTYMMLWQEILSSGGLSRMARNHIHFTTCTSTNTVVSGMRSDCEVVIYISLTRAMADGLQFFRSTNGVVLTPGDELGKVSSKYFDKVVALADGAVLWPEPSSQAASLLDHVSAKTDGPDAEACQDADTEDEEAVAERAPATSSNLSIEVPGICPMLNGDEVLAGSNVKQIINSISLLLAAESSTLLSSCLELLQTLVESIDSGALLGAGSSLERLIPRLCSLEKGRDILYGLIQLLQWWPRYTQLISLDFKSEWLSELLQENSEDAPAPVRLEVQREQLLASLCAGLAQCSNSLSWGIDVSFTDESDDEGEEDSNHRQEFFRLAADEFMKLGLFVSKDGRNSSFHINPEASSEEQLRQFELCGKVIGLALLHQETVPSMRLSPALRKLLLSNAKLGMQDLAAVDPNFYQSHVLRILEGQYTQEEPPKQLSDLGLTFEDEIGGVKTALCWGGAERVVSEENKCQYIEKLCHHRLLDCVRPQVDALLRGVHQLISPEVQSQLQRTVSAAELGMILCGATKLNLQEWFMSTEGRDRIKEIARSTSLPELVAQEGACRMKLLTKVESMSKMQQKFNMEQRSHVSRVKKHEGSRKAGPMPSATLTFAPQSSYTQHSELGQCFEEVQQLETALVALQKRKHALQSQEWQTTAVKPIQASGCARSQSITNMQAWFKAYGEPSGAFLAGNALVKQGTMRHLRRRLTYALWKLRCLWNYNQTSLEEASTKMDELSPEAWQMFWEALEAMTPEQQNGMLEFATGSFHLPEGGLAALQFSVAPTRSMEPTAVPCFSTLYLPSYNSVQEMRPWWRIQGLALAFSLLELAYVASWPTGITVNMLTPGVPIMDHLTSALREHLKQLQADGQLPQDLRIAVSGPEEAGEGEHKISCQMLRNESAAQAPGGDECHIIVGTDSDLLLVPVGLHRGPKRVAVTRREDGLTQRKSALRVFSGDRLVQAMGRQLHSFATQPQPAAPTPKDLQQLRLDFLLVMLFRGNDYLPALVSGHDPADLWTQYLRWRQSAIGAAGIVQMENVGEEQGGVVLPPGQLSAFLQAQGSGWLPARLSGVVPKDGATRLQSR
ncbi:TRPT1 [Symbiodinium sp. CCMP2592]|nr:TRPT1 [Symbiodinium sp. CCMP2592]